MASKTSPAVKILRREGILLAVLLIIGIAALPVAVFWVGNAVFGNYSGEGLGDFFADLMGRLGNAELSAWFLVLAPYLGIQVARLTFLGWRRPTPAEPAAGRREPDVENV